jgi:chorismate mutase
MKDQLEDLRKQIDEIDELIVSLLAKRMKIVKEIGRIKKENNLPVFDKSRWQEVIKSKKGFLKKIWKIIHEEALKIENSI